MSNRNYKMEALSVALQLSWEGGNPMPVMLYGVPGSGKTQVVKQLGAALAAELKHRGLTEKFHVDLNVLPQTMPETIEGIAALAEDANGNKYLYRYPQAGIRALLDAVWGIWVGDEITSCPQATGAASMTLIQDGVAGDSMLPKTIARVAMGNPPDCAAAGRDLSYPEVNRFLVLDWELPMEDFLDYLQGGKGLLNHILWLPKGWEAQYRPLADTLVVNYLKSNPNHVNLLQKQTAGSQNTATAQEGAPWASQRQWENLIRLLAAAFSVGEEPASQLCYTFMEGTVGEAVAKSFMAYVREFDLPSPEVVLKEALKADSTPESIRATVPDTVWRRPDKTRILLESVAVFAVKAPEKLRAVFWAAGFKVIEPLLDTAPDTAMSAAHILMNNKPPGATIPAIAVKLFAARAKAGLTKA